jgi:DNA-binding transcriptional LysR family regulator
MDTSDFHLLLTLDALLQEGSVTAAAKRLGLSTPAVSHALARMRARLDDPLLVRAGRGMVLTPRAQTLRAHVSAAVEAAALVFKPPASFDPSRLEGCFSLSMTDYVMTIFGDAFEQRVHAGAPKLDLRFLPNAVDDPERLRRAETDLVVGIYGDLPPELRARPIITDRLVCVVRRGHPATQHPLTLDAFLCLDHLQVAPRGRPGGYVDDLLAARGLRRRVARAVPYFHVALSMTAQTDYILTISERIALSSAAALGLHILEPPLPLAPFALSMVWHPRFDQDQAHRWLRDQLLAATQTLSPMPHKNPRRHLDDTDPTTGQGRKRRRSPTT